MRTAHAGALVACLAGLSAAGPAAERTGQDTAAAIMALADPRADDWPVEVAAAAVAGQLRELAGRLARGEVATASLSTAVVADGATATALWPGPAEVTQTAGGFRVWRAAADPGAVRVPVRQALAELARAFAGPPAPRFRFEVLRVDPGDSGALRSRVVLDCAGQGAAGPLGAALELDIDWAAGTEPGAGPRILSITLAGLRAADRATPLFQDATGAVLPAAADWYPEVARGAEYWHGRLDAVGQAPLLGHHGVAVGDIDGDGLEDLYVAQGEGLPNRLLRQGPDGTVRDVAAAAGVDWLDDTQGALFADMDNDGDQDLLLALGPSVVLAKNDGQGRFDRLFATRVPGGTPFSTLALADYDLDGDLDVYATCQARPRFGQGVPVPLNRATNGPVNRLLRNDGDDRYTDVTVQVGLAAHGGAFGFGAAWGDYDGDGDPDLFVPNSAGPDNLFRNDAGRFVDVALQAGVADLGAGAGASFGDFDLDGHLDLHVTGAFSAAGLRIMEQAPFLPSATEEIRTDLRALARGGSLFAGRGDGTFRDASDAAGVRGTGSGFGGRFVDLDADGLDDLVIPQGFLTGSADGPDLSSLYWRHVAGRSPSAGANAEQQGEYVAAWAALARLAAEGRSLEGHQPNRALLNLGDGTFADVSHPAGLGHVDDGRAAAAVDWDADGDLDLWLASRRGPRLRFLDNSARENGSHFVGFLLQGTRCNRDAVGASVEVRSGGRTLVRTVTAGDGFLSQSSRWLYFGLDGAKSVERVRIRWPGGESLELHGLAADRRHVVVQGAAKTVTRKRRPPRIAALPFAAPPPAPEGMRILLRVPLPLPPTLRRFGDAQAEAGRPRVYVFWDPSSVASVDHLADLAAQAEGLRQAGLELVVLSVAAPASPPPLRSEPAGPDAIRVLEVLWRHVLDDPAGARWPVGLLVDAGAELQAMHVGPVPAAAWLGVATLLDPGLPASRRSLYGGRWYYRISRDLPALSRALKALDLRDDARHYLGIHELGVDQKNGEK